MHGETLKNVLKNMLRSLSFIFLSPNHGKGKYETQPKSKVNLLITVCMTI